MNTATTVAMAAGARRGKARQARRHDVVAALATSDEAGKWSLVIARRGDGGATEPTRVVFAGVFATGDGASIRREVLAQKATLLVRVVPTRRSIGRVVRVPIATEADLARTLGLIVEAEMPPNVPAHRAGAAVLPAGGEGQTRSVVLTGWTHAEAAADGANEPVVGVLEGVEERWCTPLGALCALRGREDGAIVDARESEGAMSVLAARAEQAAARVIVDEPDDDHSWDAVVSDALAEACELAGLAGPDGSANDEEVESMLRGAWPGTEAASATLAKRASAGVTGVLSAGSLRKHASALGACLAVLDEQLGMAGLANLRREAPKVHEPAITRMVKWASVPRRAAVLAALGLAVMLLAPWGIGWARLSVAQARGKDLPEVRNKSKDVELRAALYQQVEQARWPMTKLLSDIGGAAPVGVTVTETRLTVGQSISLEGVAASRELVTQFEAALNASKVFSKVTPKNVAPKGDEVEFTYTLEIAAGTAMHAPVKPAEDFVAQPLAVRLHGEGATNTLPPKGASQVAPGRRANSSAGEGGAAMPTSGGSRTPAASGESRRPSSGTATNEPPAEIKDEEIAKLNASEAMKSWAERKRFLSANPKADPAVRTRVEEEATKLQARMKEAREAEAKKEGAK
jgi:Tfp pilus assembly protein PilN